MEEFKYLEEKNSNLKTKVKELEDLRKQNNILAKEKRQLQIELEGIQKDCMKNSVLEKQVEDLNKECKNLSIKLGKQKVSDDIGRNLENGETSCLGLQNPRALQSADRIGMLVKLDDRKSLWFQLRKEKQRQVCGHCRSHHPHSQCRLLQKDQPNGYQENVLQAPRVQIFFQSKQSPRGSDHSQYWSSIIEEKPIKFQPEKQEKRRKRSPESRGSRSYSPENFHVEKKIHIGNRRLSIDSLKSQHKKANSLKLQGESVNLSESTFMHMGNHNQSLDMSDHVKFVSTPAEDFRMFANKRTRYIGSSHHRKGKIKSKDRQVPTIRNVFKSHLLPISDLKRMKTLFPSDYKCHAIV